MTIGPEPMRRIFCRSWRLGTAFPLLMLQHTGEKRCEELPGIVWPRRRFGMELYGEDGQLAMPHAFDGTVVEVDMRRLEGIRHGVRIDSEPVVFRGDQDPFGVQITDRLIAPMVAKFQFDGLGAAGQREELMPETDPHDRPDPQAFFNLLNNIEQGGGVPWPIRQKDAIRLHLEHGLRWSPARLLSDSPNRSDAAGYYA